MRRAKTSLLNLMLIALGVALALGGSIAIGFAGAIGRNTFDWRLSAEVATALGTVLLASYTAWLATTTREEVQLAIDEQRARDRPIVVAIPTEVGRALLDATIGSTVPVLAVQLQNVGLGPAIDIELTVRPSADSTETVSGDVLAVLPVGGAAERSLSLSSLVEPTGGFRVETFQVDGRYHDRTRSIWHPIVTLEEHGLRDEQREAQRVANTRAALWLMPGLELARTPTEIEYVASLVNNGLGTAEGVTVWVFDADYYPMVEPVDVGDVRGGTSGLEVLFRLPNPHAQYTFSVQWRDGLGNHQQEFGPF